jgi:predicted dehydrogenase
MTVNTNNMSINHTFNIAIIGAGQLGSRHLQGLKLANLELNIFVMDVNDNSLQIAKERYEQIPENVKTHNLHLCKSIVQLPSEIDLAIIATGSLVRASITRELLEISHVKNIIFEKVLFPALHEYTQIENLLLQKNVSAWVNCTRRIFDHYTMLKKILSETKIVFKMTGKDWGLGCNAIHFLDLFVFLSGEKEFSLTMNLDKEIHQSKRAGYVEFTGTITGTAPNGSTCTISSFKEYEHPACISIQGEQHDILIEEANNKMIINGVEQTIHTPFQSQLTGKMAEQILLQGKSDLTPFFESAQIHQQFLAPLTVFYNSLTGKNSDYCPIT